MTKNLKPITEISKEDLLDLVNSNTNKVTIFDYKNDLLDFISTYNIIQGENRIPGQLIYNLYKRWSKNPLHRNHFGQEMSQLFPNIRYGQGNVFLINKEKDYFLEKIVNKKQNKTKRKPWLTHFNKFIDKYQLKSGRFYVKDIVLYNLYDKWTYKNGNKNPLGFQQFLKFCRLFFSKPARKMINKHEWFSIDSNIKNHLTDNLLELMKK